ncbi:MAG: ABC transporter permease [Bacteroidales bacterium]|nr:ABC transporter permease [Bacteroidales bacterium]
MNILYTLLIKEFKQIFRNRFMLPVIFVIPVVQMIVLTYAASLEMKDIRMAVVDQDFSSASRLLISEFSGSPFFEIEHQTSNYDEAMDMLGRDRVDVILHIQHNFEKKLYIEYETDLQLVVNAINATEAGLVNAYCNQIITGFNSQIRADWFGMEPSGTIVSLEIIPEFWYNPLLDYKIYMFSGILVILVTLIGMLLTALNLVREKEMGTTEQINVTPIRKYQFIIAKLLPFWVIAIFELAFGLLVGRILYDLPMVGDLGLLFLFASIYLFVVLGIGLFLSTISNTQQQLMFVAFFFMITFILMSGVFTPVDSMPRWAQQINIINPAAYFMRVIRMILLKGSGFQDISREFYSMGFYAVIILTLAVTNYRKTT